MQLRSTFVCTICAVALVFAAAQEGNAAFKMRVSVGDESFEITDDQLMDQAPDTEGLLKFSVVGLGGYDIIINVGSSKPLLGSLTEPALDLLSLEVGGQGSDPLVLELTDTGFTDTPVGLSPASFISSIGGTTTGSVAFQTYYDAGNAEFGKTTLLADSGQLEPTGGLAFAYNEIDAIDGTAPFSLTMVVSVTNGEGQYAFTSFDAAVIAAPEPASAAVWLAALPIVGTAVIAARRRRKAGAR